MQAIRSRGHKDALVELIEWPGYGDGFFADLPCPRFDLRLYVRHPRHGTSYLVTTKQFWTRREAIRAYEKVAEDWCTSGCRRWISKLMRQGTADEDVPYGEPVC